MTDHADNKVIPLRQVDTEAKLLAHFERVQTELVTINTIEDALKVRDKAELLRILAIKVRAAKATLDSIAEVRVRAERKLGQLISDRPETRGGDRRSEDFQRYSVSTFENLESPTLTALGVSKNLSSRSQLIAAIPQEKFEERIRYTIKQLNRGRDLSAEMFDFAKFLRREQERQERRRAAAEEARRVEPDDHIRIFHGDFREVLNEEIVPTDSVSLLLTDPMYGREHLPLWTDLAEFASRALKLGNLLVAYSGQTYLPEVLKSLEAHLTYVWVGGVRYSYPNNIFPLRIKNSLKLLLLFSKGEYDPGPSQYWLHDLIDGDGYPETKKDSELQQGCKEAEYLIETLTQPGDLVVDPFTGTGTVAVAAKRTGRRFVGAEISKERYDIAMSRMAQEPEPT